MYTIRFSSQILHTGKSWETQMNQELKLASQPKYIWLKYYLIIFAVLVLMAKSISLGPLEIFYTQNYWNDFLWRLKKRVWATNRTREGISKKITKLQNSCLLSSDKAPYLIQHHPSSENINQPHPNSPSCTKLHLVSPNFTQPQPTSLYLKQPRLTLTKLTDLTSLDF